MKALGIKPTNFKKEAGIPNMCPFKDKLLEQLEAKEKADQEHIQRLKESKVKQEDVNLLGFMDEVQSKIV